MSAGPNMKIEEELDAVMVYLQGASTEDIRTICRVGGYDPDQVAIETQSVIESEIDKSRRLNQSTELVVAPDLSVFRASHFWAYAGSLALHAVVCFGILFTLSVNSQAPESYTPRSVMRLVTTYQKPLHARRARDLKVDSAYVDPGHAEELGLRIRELIQEANALQLKYRTEAQYYERLAKEMEVAVKASHALGVASLTFAYGREEDLLSIVERYGGRFVFTNATGAPQEGNQVATVINGAIVASSLPPNYSCRLVHPNGQWSNTPLLHQYQRFLGLPEDVSVYLMFPSEFETFARSTIVASLTDGYRPIEWALIVYDPSAPLGLRVEQVQRAQKQ